MGPGKEYHNGGIAAMNAIKNIGKHWTLLQVSVIKSNGDVAPVGPGSPCSPSKMGRGNAGHDKKRFSMRQNSLGEMEVQQEAAGAKGAKRKKAKDKRSSEDDPAEVEIGKATLILV
jgi:hypothetical protein